jgi:acyl-CoA reductase-like NAD-dependent aldehyde dehydrogenase
MATPAVRLRPVVLELGGKSANLLFDDVGLDEFIRVEGVGVSRH